MDVLTPIAIPACAATPRPTAAASHLPTKSIGTVSDKCYDAYGNLLAQHRNTGHGLEMESRVG